MTPSIDTAAPRVVVAVLASTASTIGLIVLALVLIGLGMTIVTTWLIRSTRSDPPALAPLEVMGERRWRRAGPDERTAMREEARPAGARPPAPIVQYDVAAARGDAPGGETPAKSAGTDEPADHAQPVGTEQPADGQEPARTAVRDSDAGEAAAAAGDAGEGEAVADGVGAEAAPGGSDSRPAAADAPEDDAPDGASPDGPAVSESEPAVAHEGTEAPAG